MKWKWHSPEQIVEILAAVRSELARGRSVADAVAIVGVSQATYFRWRTEYGAQTPRQLDMLKSLQKENSRLRRALMEYDAVASMQTPAVAVARQEQQLSI